MVRDQGPGIALGLGFFEDDGETFKEGVAVLVVSEKLSSFNSPGHDVLEEAGSIKSGLAWHDLFFWHEFHRLRCFGFLVVVIQIQTPEFLLGTILRRGIGIEYKFRGHTLISD